MIFRLLASLGLNTANFEAGMKRATSMATRAGSAMAASMKGWLAGAFGLYAIQSATRKSIEYAGAIKDASSALGVSTDTLQLWSYAAAQTGATLDDFTRAFNKLQKDNPNLTLAETLKLFNAITDTIAGGGLGPSGNASLAFERFGRSGLKILPALTQGLRDFQKEADRFGLFGTPEQIDQVDALGDSLSGLAFAITSKLVPALGEAHTQWLRMYAGIKAVWGLLFGPKGSVQIPSLKKEQRSWLEANGLSQLIEVYGEGVLGQMLDELDKSKASRTTTNAVIPKSMQQAVEQQRFGMVSPEVTDRQRVGAYSGATPVFIQEQRKQTTYLQQINQNTFETKEAVTRKD